MSRVRLSIVATAFIYLLTLSGCGTSDQERKGNAARALSQLKKFQTATTVYETEYGEYASLELLLDDDASGLIEAGLEAAWDGQSQPTPLGGYLYAAMDAEDELERVGLCAYPSEPGKTGDVILCTFADLEDMETPEEAAGGFVVSGEEWSFYVARVQDVSQPPQYWPDDGIPPHFTRMKKRKPAQALEEAWRLLEGEP